MSCGCIYVGDYDHAPFYNTKKPKAIKWHICGECGREIEPGEIYESIFAVFDGKPGTHKTCFDCISMRDEFFCEGYIFGRIWEHAAEHIQDMEGEISGDCLASLTPIARTGIIELIDQVFEEINAEEEEPDAQENH